MPNEIQIGNRQLEIGNNITNLT